MITFRRYRMMNHMQMVLAVDRRLRHMLMVLADHHLHRKLMVLHRQMNRKQSQLLK